MATSSGTALQRSPVTMFMTDWMPMSWEKGVAETGCPVSSCTRGGQADGHAREPFGPLR